MIDDATNASILIVDDEPDNLRLLTALLRRGGLVPRPVLSGRLAIEAAAADPPDLVLLDVKMPEMSGFDVCRWFKQDQRLRDIPVVFLSGLSGIDDKVEAFRLGAVDYVSKPFDEVEVLARVQTHLRCRRMHLELTQHADLLERRVTEQVRAMTTSQLATIFALAKLAETRDDDTGHHIERVQTFTQTLADRMRELRLHPATLTADFVDHLRQSASLHDIGKVAIPDAVLLKPGKLTNEEFTVMQRHSALGADTLAVVLQRHPDNQFLRLGVEVARSHHERWDGRGYPDGLAGPTIPLAARIVAVADVYDALTSDRCYRPAFDHDRSCAMIREGRGTQFDPEVVAAFEDVAGPFRRIRAELGGDGAA